MDKIDYAKYGHFHMIPHCDNCQTEKITCHTHKDNCMIHAVRGSGYGYIDVSKHDHWFK